MGSSNLSNPCTYIMYNRLRKQNLLNCTLSYSAQLRSLEKLCLLSSLLPHCQMWPITCPICSENLTESSVPSLRYNPGYGSQRTHIDPPINVDFLRNLDQIKRHDLIVLKHYTDARVSTFSAVIINVAIKYHYRPIGCWNCCQTQ